MRASSIVYLGFVLSALRAAYLWRSPMHIVLARKEKRERRNEKPISVPERDTSLRPRWAF